jgi:hypothetical protein
MVEAKGLVEFPEFLNGEQAPVLATRPPQCFTVVVGGTVIGQDLPALEIFKVSGRNGEELSFAENKVRGFFEFSQQEFDHTSFTPYSLR